MSELSDESSEPELLNRSLSMWHGLGAQVSREELDVPLDLHTAASIGQYEVVKECVQRRELDLNKKNGGGWTPLMYASYIGHDTIVHLLLEAGVSVNVPTPEGQTPLMLASSCGNESIAYFLLQQGAELEMKDIQGWTALFHCTSAGHQQMVKFLLESGANANVREPVYGFTPLMEAAASGHEIIVQYFLNHGVKVDTRDHSGATAPMLARQYGHMKIVALMEAHSPLLPKSLYRSPEKYEDLSSSDESWPVPQRQRPCRKKGLSIHEGPRALARITAIGLGGKTPTSYEQLPPRGYVTFTSSDENTMEGEGLCYRDVTSPINERDVESSSSSSREEPTFCASLGPVWRSSSSDGLARAQGLSSEASIESNEDSDHARKSSVRKQTRSYLKNKSRHSNSDGHWPSSTGTACTPGSEPQTEKSPYSGPQDLATLLEQIGCLKYLQVFEEQDVDLRIFLTLTESDLKEIGITLFGPKRKMTSAIARWHSSARPPSDALELAYADRLEAEMQELAIQLHKCCEETEALRGQVSQEQELRAVVESCLLEQDSARKDIHAQLQEAQTLAQDAALVLDQLRACQAELSARVRQHHFPSEATQNSPFLPADSKGWPIPLQALSLPELSGVLEDHVHEMGIMLCNTEPGETTDAEWEEMAGILTMKDDSDVG
ncbi:ankyrin repeat and SAM domain-containing protein 3 isoform X1 [Arvicanthis niloticus]|uniref:ankyrin repeat and SAM domain-containing protein 3 isoform X1 n=3 Tax=Arvicanthis niloticus TaxID=61156 RepID=UPI0014865CD7|nr:ankyrin repeat and SAM domain-containing protein 3 isoform X1 [Arvicanthis niloticus]XP_034361442.1 ankyrin repeat and SAM domain-containing protein 3 isoform X1 [Arvicanthis niloticus]XP_034361444.1 ankyrin repeat and SAM domain-containing protein 3 isoform X1 [Arvicanthis niloticus]